MPALTVQQVRALLLLALLSTGTRINSAAIPPK